MLDLDTVHDDLRQPDPKLIWFRWTVPDDIVGPEHNHHDWPDEWIVVKNDKAAQGCVIWSRVGERYFANTGCRGLVAHLIRENERLEAQAEQMVDEVTAAFHPTLDGFPPMFDNPELKANELERQIPKVKLPGSLRESLADLEHRQWAHWTDHMLKELAPLIAGQVDTVEYDQADRTMSRWLRQIATDYERLTEAEKDSDREWANKVLELVGQAEESAWADLAAIEMVLEGDENAPVEDGEISALVLAARKQWECDWNDAGDYELLKDLMAGRRVAPAPGSVSKWVQDTIEACQHHLDEWGKGDRSMPLSERVLLACSGDTTEGWEAEAENHAAFLRAENRGGGMVVCADCGCMMAWSGTAEATPPELCPRCADKRKIAKLEADLEAAFVAGLREGQTYQIRFNITNEIAHRDFQNYLESLKPSS